MSRKTKARHKQRVNEQERWYREQRAKRELELIQAGCTDIQNPWPPMPQRWIQDEDGVWHFTKVTRIDLAPQWHSLCNIVLWDKFWLSLTVTWHPDYFPWHETCEECYRLRIMQKLSE